MTYKKLIVLTVALLTGSAAFSQIHKMERKDSSAVHRTYNLNPVVVTGSGHHQRLKSTATPVRVPPVRRFTNRVSPLLMVP